MYENYLHLVKNKNGFGVYTDVIIPSRVPILEFRGDIFNKENLKHPPSKILQIDLSKYLGPSGSLDDFVNHSCNPNCFLHIVGNRAMLYSRYQIAANSELTFDYSTSSTDDINTWVMDCNCGYFKCRQKISGIQSLPKDVKNQYTQENMIPLFLRMNV